MVQVTCTTISQQVTAFQNKIYSNSKERKDLVAAIFARGSPNSLLRVSKLLNSEDVRKIQVAYEKRISFLHAIRLLAVFLGRRGYLPVRKWLLDIVLKAPMRHLIGEHGVLYEKNKGRGIWWPHAALKCRAERTLFLKTIMGYKDGQFVGKLLQDKKVFSRFTSHEQEEILHRVTQSVRT